MNVESIDDDFFETEEKGLIPKWVYPIIGFIVIVGIVVFLFASSYQSYQNKQICDKIQSEMKANFCDFDIFENKCNCCYNTSSEVIEYCELYSYSFRNETILIRKIG